MHPTEARGTILIVEDNPELREVIREVLVAEGYRVEEVADGEGAVLRLQASVPDLVLLDMNLPGMRGEEVLARIAQLPGEPPTVIAMTGSTELNPSAAAILQKPFDVAELLELAHRFSGRRRRAAPVTSSFAGL